ncbi:polysaccharide deacetylase family protein [Halomicrococcus sp. NG-SE-24]|uniref:polysaccharide deacetylase family protein n=1 Tax=Halomicrococcus sp. NG-SE-24 TaxID=3436928 RepID=UPI003D95EDBD
MSNSPNSATRRAVLKNGLAIAGAPTVTGMAATAAPPNGKLVFTYDDGPIEDYTHTYQKAHRREGVPACSAVPSSYVGKSGNLSGDQIQELTDEGWEIMSHSVKHRMLGHITVTRDIAANDQKIYVEENFHGSFPGDTLVVSNGSQSATVTVSGKGSDNRGKFVRVQSSVGQSFTASDEVFTHYTKDVIQTALKKSKRQLEGYGVNVTNIVMPYAGYGKRTREMVDEYYTAVANAESTAGGSPQIMEPSQIRLPHLSRMLFREGSATKSELRTFLDKIASQNGLGILGGHSWWQERLPPSRIRMVIRMAKDRNIDIVTLRDALADFGITTSQTTSATTNAQTTTNRSTTKTDQPGFGVLAALASIGSAAALKRYLTT